MQAFIIGIHPNEFWGMTAWQLRMCIKGHAEKHQVQLEESISMAWHTANFSRAGKLPKLSDILSRMKQPIEKAATSDIIGIMKKQLKRRGQ